MRGNSIITKSVRTTVDVDIEISDVIEFLENASIEDDEELVEFLKKEGYIIGYNYTYGNVLDEQWSSKIQKLNNIRYKISNEDEEKIDDILKNY